jgi:hypothetical protein
MSEIKKRPSPVSDDEDLKVGPIEAESAAQIYARLEMQEYERRRAVEEPPPVAPLPPFGGGLTFSLRQLFIAITVLSVWLGVLRWMNSLNQPIITGLVGIGALAVLFWISIREDQSPTVRLVWWGMLLAYISSLAITMLTN